MEKTLERQEWREGGAILNGCCAHSQAERSLAQLKLEGSDDLFKWGKFKKKRGGARGTPKTPPRAVDSGWFFASLTTHRGGAMDAQPKMLGFGCFEV